MTGSLDGLLRVHQPHDRGFTASDLLLEVQLQGPILQLELGNFASYALTCFRLVLGQLQVSNYVLSIQTWRATVGNFASSQAGHLPAHKLGERAGDCLHAAEHSVTARTGKISCQHGHR